MVSKAREILRLLKEDEPATRLPNGYHLSQKDGKWILHMPGDKTQDLGQHADAAAARAKAQELIDKEAPADNDDADDDDSDSDYDDSDDTDDGDSDDDDIDVSHISKDDSPVDIDFTDFETEEDPDGGEHSNFSGQIKFGDHPVGVGGNDFEVNTPHSLEIEKSLAKKFGLSDDEAQELYFALANHQDGGKTTIKKIGAKKFLLSNELNGDEEIDVDMGDTPAEG